jgi:hypothetical protein
MRRHDGGFSFDRRLRKRGVRLILGCPLKEWTLRTVRPGQTIMKDGRILGGQGYGTYQHRSFLARTPGERTDAGQSVG